YPIETGPLETAKPVGGDVEFARRRRQVKRRDCGREQRFEYPATLLEGRSAEIPFAFAQQIEKDDRGRNLLGKKLHPRCRGMNAQLQRIEIQPAVSGDDDLAVEHRATP